MPAGWLKVAANPLKSGGHLSRFGIGWFAQKIFLENPDAMRSDIIAALDKADEEYGEILKKSPLLSEFDLEEAEQSDKAREKLQDHKESLEWWLYLAGGFRSLAKSSIEKGDAASAAWAMACAERFRSLYIFKEYFEEVVWMGHSAKKLTDLLSLWDANKINSDEEFWQVQLQSHSHSLSQLFSVPVTFISGKAYVGGQGIDRSDAKFVDFLFSGGTANDAILIERKTPVMPLVAKSKYRKSIHGPSAALTGSVVQLADYRHSLVRDFSTLTRDSNRELSAFNPKAIVIAGDYSQLDTAEKRRSFELFRSNLANMEIVTFDELFKK